MMDERVLKWITATICVLTIIVCGTVSFFSQIHERSVLAAEEYYGVVEAEGAAVPSQNPNEVVETASDLDGKLSIELPENVDFSAIALEDDYLTQTVYLTIPTNSADYFSDYRVRGSCDHIQGISYYQQDGKGVIALMLDKVYELETGFEEGNVYLSFLDPHEVYDRVIVIDAGHGGRDGGADKLGIAEKEINLAILLELKELLDDSTENIGVYYTRTDDTNPSLDQRVQLANKADADLFISIHNNASHNGSLSGLNGTEVMYSESDDSLLSSKRFAQICQDQVTAALGSKDIGLLEGDSIYIIRTSEVPVALIEVGFVTNREELAKLTSQDYQKQAAQGIYNAIEQAFEEGY
jgi:N-acetylmuramoyl-L-alanine amidase